MSGSLARTTTSMARLATSRSGSRSSWVTGPTAIGPSIFDSALSAAWRISLFGSLQLRLDRRRDVRPVEARQDVDDVHARDRVLALDAAGQLGDRRFVGELADDAEQRHLLVRLLAVRVLQQIAHREALLLGRDDLQHGRLGDVLARQQFDQQRGAVVVARRERPAHGRDRARAAVRQALHEHREGLVVDQLRQDLDVRGRFLLVRDGERVEDLRDRAGADLRELLERLLRFRMQRIANSADVRDQPLSFQIRKETHPVISVSMAADRDRLVKLVPRRNGTDVRIACCKLIMPRLPRYNPRPPDPGQNRPHSL